LSAEAEFTFISYSHYDADFALRIAEALRHSDARVWLDQLSLKHGDGWDIKVQKALADCGTMLVILSPASAESPSVLDEVSYALNKKKRVIPVLYRECEVPFRLARLHYIDFRPSYEAGITSLFTTLGITKQAAASPTPTLVPDVNVILITGVTGVRTTSVGMTLADELGWRFVDADLFQPPENVAKMRQGIPLKDSDRFSWLGVLFDALATYVDENEKVVLMCSAIRKKWINLLAASPKVKRIHLVTVIRMGPRVANHADLPLLQSNFETLDVYDDATKIDADKGVEDVVKSILNALRTKRSNSDK
jgi:carbohydrate kinase (thermoresistant glucokinase family)